MPSDKLQLSASHQGSILLLSFSIIIVWVNGRSDSSGLFTGQLSRKPSILRKVNHKLAQTSCIDGHTLPSQNLSLVCSARRMPSDWNISILISLTSNIDEALLLAYLGEIIPFELMTRCHGTLPSWKVAVGSEERCFRQTPTWRGRWAFIS